MGVPDKQYPMTVYRLILMTAAAVWGLGFVIGKGAIGTVGATWFTAIRFLGAGIVLVILLFPHLKRNFCRKTLKAGLIIGMATFVGFWTQFLGLGLTTPSKNAFLSACYCLTVPFIWWVVSRRRPPAKTLIAAAICTVGIGLVSLTEGFSISLGDGVSIASAFLYGGEIVIIGLVMRDNDVLTITVVQQFTAGLLALLLALVTQPMPTMAQVATPGFIGAMTYVAMLSRRPSAPWRRTQRRLTCRPPRLACSARSKACSARCSAWRFSARCSRSAWRWASRSSSPPSWQPSSATRAAKLPRPAPQPTGLQVAKAPYRESPPSETAAE